MNDLRDSMQRAAAVLAVAVLAACGSAEARDATPDTGRPSAQEPVRETPAAERLLRPVPERREPAEPPVLRRGPDRDDPLFRERLLPEHRRDRPAPMRVA
jgi:hypothetical protein